MAGTVVHLLGETRMCQSIVDADPSWWRSCLQPAHGVIVTCGGCRQMGILPDAGHLADFLPDGWIVNGQDAPAP